MPTDPPILTGAHIRLEPLRQNHADALVAAAAVNPSFYRWSPVPRTKEEACVYVETALSWQDAGTALPFAIVRISDDVVLGSTRFWQVEHWPWPQGHARHGRPAPDACEIGYTWLSGDAVRTAANTESKLLLLTYAFETWQALRVCLHADARNQRSRAAIERIGGKFEGILRAHRMAADFIPRDSARYSIVTAEWPQVKQMLTNLLAR